MSRLKIVAIVFAATLVVGGLATWRLLGFHTLKPYGDRLPEQEVVSWEVYGALLDAYVDNGSVDYAGLRADRRLEQLYATIAEVGPQTRPDLFEGEDYPVAYYVNAYNILTLLGVARSWPVESVHDIQGVIEPVDGFGFFFATRFRLDGERLNLYRLENHYLREKTGDARIHAAINCASASCPTLYGEPYRERGIQMALDQAATRLVANDEHVHLDIGNKEVVLNEIFFWFESDFVNHASRVGFGDDLLDWLINYANAQTAARLQQAQQEGWTVRSRPYDWSVNAIER